jgi:hypothetical protein
MTKLRFHPLASIFPLMEGEEFDALVADIKANGLREKIDLYQGKIIDGRNRYRALQQLDGIDPSANPGYFRKAIYAHTSGGDVAPHEQDNDARMRAYVISKNIHRRHLTAEQKREIIAKVIAAKPEASDRQIAKQVKADHKTVGSVRAERESTGELSPVEKRVGLDGKARKRPAKKANRKAREARELARVEEEGKRVFQAEAEELAADLINADRELARALHEFLECIDAVYLIDALGHLLELGDVLAAAPVENAPPPDVGADNMKAQIAALDDGDPGPMPENLRRAS